MAKDYPNPPRAGSETLLPFHDAASDQNLSILQARLDVAKAVEKRTANYLRIAEDDNDADLVRYLMRKLAEQKLKVSRCETRIVRETINHLMNEVAFLRSKIKRPPVKPVLEAGILTEADILRAVSDLESRNF